MSQVLIITGMHRSATSLIASLFGAGGVHLGAQLLEPNYQNPRGFFEDADFFDFHEGALLARGETILLDHPFRFLPTADEAARADGLLRARATLPLWGWKDPRTCLFFDFWNERLPQAHWVLVYRHPFEVLLSLLRRNEGNMPGLLRGLDAWCTYNVSLLEIRQQIPERTLLCHCYGVIDQPEAFNALVRERLALELTLDVQARKILYRPDELRRATITLELDGLLAQIHPQAMAVYARLNAQSDLAPTAKYNASVSPSLTALLEYANTFQAPIPLVNRRSLLIALVALQDPDTLETFVETQWRTPAEQQRELRLLHENLSQAKLALTAAHQQLVEQEAWVTPRMEDLRALEAHPVVRALRRFKLAGRGGTR